MFGYFQNVKDFIGKEKCQIVKREWLENCIKAKQILPVD